MKTIALLLGLVALSGEPEKLYVEHSNQNETLDDFAFRIAPRARGVTAEIDAEICGSFQKNGERYRITFATNRSEWGCNIDFINDGDWKATRMTMHTHTANGGQGFSDQDNRHRLQGYLVATHTFTKRVGNIERSRKL